MSDELPIYNFRENTLLNESEFAFRTWMSKASSFFADFWRDVSDYAAQVTAGPITTDTFAKLLENICRDDMHGVAQIENRFRSVWYASTKDLRLIADEMLGLPSENDEESDLSAVELSLTQLFFESLAVAIGDGWMGEDTLQISISQVTKDPRKARIFRNTDSVIQATITIELKSQQANIVWLMAEHSANSLLDEIADHRESDAPRTLPAERIARLPFDLVAELGRAKIPMSKLNQLKVGETIMLDQRIDRPLSALINDVPFYECWPGQLQGQQAIEISNSLNEKIVAEKTND